MVGRVIQLAMSFVTTMLVTRYLGPGTYGRLTYVFSYIQLFLPVCALGMNDIIVKTLLDNKENSDEIMGTVIGMRLIVSIVCMICSVSLVALMNNDPSYRMIAILQSFSLAFYSFDSIIYFFQANLLSKNVGIVLSLSYTLVSLFRITGIVLKKDLVWFGFGMSLDYIIQAVLLMIAYFRNGRKLVFNKAYIKELLKRSSHYMIAGLLVVIYGKVTDILLLGKLVDETNVGYYGSAITLCNAWPFVLTAIIDTANPIIISLFDHNKPLFEKRIRQLYSAIFYISLLASLGILVVGNFVISLLYGRDFLPAAMPLKIYSFSTAFSYLGVARVAWMQCNEKTRYETRIALFGAVVNVALNYILIRSFGINGAALAAVLTQFLTNFVFLFAMKDTRENAKLILDAILLRGVLNREEDTNV